MLGSLRSFRTTRRLVLGTMRLTENGETCRSNSPRLQTLNAMLVPSTEGSSDHQSGRARRLGPRRGERLAQEPAPGGRSTLERRGARLERRTSDASFLVSFLEIRAELAGEMAEFPNPRTLERCLEAATFTQLVTNLPLDGKPGSSAKSPSLGAQSAGGSDLRFPESLWTPSRRSRFARFDPPDTRSFP